MPRYFLDYEAADQQFRLVSIFEKYCERIFGAPPRIADEDQTYLERFITHECFSRSGHGVLNDEPMRLAAGFYHDPEFGAAAYPPQEGVDIIGISWGTVWILSAAFKMLVSHGELFPSIGDPTIAQEPLYYMGDFDSDGLTAKSWNIHQLADPAREELASKLAHLALMYIADHEFFHVWNGHTSWIGRHFSGQGIIEVSSPDSTVEIGIIRQTMEYDADVAATQDLMSFVFKPIIDTSVLPSIWTLPDATDWGTIEDGIFVIGLVVRVLHQLMMQPEEIDESTLKSTHPPGLVRVIYYAGQISHVMKLRGDYPVEKSFELALDGAEAGSRALAKMLRMEGKFRGIDRVLFEKIDERIELYHECWKTLRPELDVLKRGGILAPARD